MHKKTTNWQRKILAQVQNAFKRYNPPADWARELFKPSTDSESLQVSI